MITVVHAQRDSDGAQYFKIELNGPSIERFKELLNRALNTWDSAHPELKELGDMFIHGKILQDYYSQFGSTKHKNE